METRTAADIYSQLRTLRHQLDQLADQGRLVMATDSLNPWKDSSQAVAAARAGLDDAIAALTWAETLATVDGDYPLLEAP